jgi:hypothetical protein
MTEEYWHSPLGFASALMILSIEVLFHYTLKCSSKLDRVFLFFHRYSLSRRTFETSRISMGAHNAKENHQLKTAMTGDDIRHATLPVPIKPSIVHPRTDYYGWQELYRCTHTEWLHGVSGKRDHCVQITFTALYIVDLFGFAQHAFTCHSELHSVCAPGFCSESLSRKLHYGFARCSRKNFPSTSRSLLPSLSSSTKSKKLREHFEYNHIPAMISSLQNYSVHGIVNGCSISSFSHGDTIMLSVYSVVLDKTQFIIVDLKLNRYVCALGNDYNGLIDPSKVHAAWSMDRAQVIVRVPISGGSTALDFYKSKRYLFYSFRSLMCLFSCEKRGQGLSPNPSH